MDRPLVTVVVAVYRRGDFLGLVLDGLLGQRDRGFEVVVAEDDRSPAIAEVVERHRERFLRQGIRLLHVTQEDRGFRKTRILNAALRVSQNPLVVFLDGDCIPHPALVGEYRAAAAPGLACYGRRVMLGPAFSDRLLAGSARSPPSLWDLLRSDSRRVEEAIRIPLFRKRSPRTGIWGCNWGVLRSHLEAVNGFDQDYQRAGVGEDVDIQWRLAASGVRLQSMKHRAVVYHLHHQQGYSDADVRANFAEMEQKKAAGLVRCRNGLA
jgi:glycosyltransferase involved in cell wall biosynthesis